MTKQSIISEIADIIESNERGVCPVCKKTCKKGSEKVVDDTFDIHQKCWDLDQRENRLVRLLHDLADYD